MTVPFKTFDRLLQVPHNDMQIPADKDVDITALNSNSYVLQMATKDV